MSEQEILQDALIAHKFLLSMYERFGLECSNSELRNLFIKQYSEVSKHNYQIFDMMKKSGFYPVTQAPEKEIKQAVKMHTQMQQDLDERFSQN